MIVIIDCGSSKTPLIESVVYEYDDTRVVPLFDFQIEELHHNRKKDNPSGTAITLQNELAAVTKTQPPKPIGIRGGGIFGVHKVWAMSDEEVLCFEHQALNRTVFARGAVRAAQWLVKKKKSGLYSMKEVLFSK